MTRYFAALALVALLLGGVVGCGGDAKKDANKDPATGVGKDRPISDKKNE